MEILAEYSRKHFCRVWLGPGGPQETSIRTVDNEQPEPQEQGGLWEKTAAPNRHIMALQFPWLSFAWEAHLGKGR